MPITLALSPTNPSAAVTAAQTFVASGTFVSGYVSNGGNLYATAGGTDNGSSGPTGTSTSPQTVGTVTYTYVGAAGSLVTQIPLPGDTGSAYTTFYNPAPPTIPFLTIGFVWSFVLSLCTNAASALIQAITGTSYTFAAGTLRAALQLIANVGARLDSNQTYTGTPTFTSGAIVEELLQAQGGITVTGAPSNLDTAVNLNAGGTVPTGQTLTIASGGTLAVNGTFTTAGFTSTGLITADDGITVTSAGSLTVQSDIVLSGTQPAKNIGPGANTFFSTHMPKSWGNISTPGGSATAGSINDGLNLAPTATVVVATSTPWGITVNFGTDMLNGNLVVLTSPFMQNGGALDQHLMIPFVESYLDNQVTIIVWDMTANAGANGYANPLTGIMFGVLARQ